MAIPSAREVGPPCQALQVDRPWDSSVSPSRPGSERSIWGCPSLPKALSRRLSFTDILVQGKGSVPALDAVSTGSDLKGACSLMLSRRTGQVTVCQFPFLNCFFIEVQ